MKTLVLMTAIVAALLVYAQSPSDSEAARYMEQFVRSIAERG